MENECEALPGVAYPGVRDNRSTINTKTGYDKYDMIRVTHTDIYWFYSGCVLSTILYVVHYNSQKGGSELVSIILLCLIIYT